MIVTYEAAAGTNLEADLRARIGVLTTVFAMAAEQDWPLLTPEMADELGRGAAEDYVNQAINPSK